MDPLRRFSRAPFGHLSFQDLYFDRLIKLDTLSDQKDPSWLACRSSYLPGRQPSVGRRQPILSLCRPAGGEISRLLGQQSYFERSPRFGCPKTDRLRETNKSFSLSYPV